MLKEKQDGINRANKFSLEIFETSVVYYVLHPHSGVFTSQSTEHYDAENNPVTVIPVWSKTYLPYARKYGEGLQIKEISFDEFYRGLLPSALESGVLLGVNWDRLGFGTEIEPNDIYNQITALTDTTRKESKGFFKSLKSFFGRSE